MFEVITIARSYAKAVFDFAVEHKALAKWRTMLEYSAEVSCDTIMMELLSSPVLSLRIAEIFIFICGDKLDVFGQNLIKILAENGRLLLLTKVLRQFIYFCNEKEGITNVEVISVHILNKVQVENIINIMEQRLVRKVFLIPIIDKSIIGGIIIKIGDTIIDGSVRGQLEDLENILQF